MKCGDIVYVNDKFIGLYGKVKSLKKRYIILYEEIINGKKYYCVCPTSSQVHSFNNNPNNYFLLSIVGSNLTKLYFAHINHLCHIKENDIVEFAGTLDSKLTIRLIEKIKENYINYGYNEYYEDILNTIEKRIGVN